MLLFVAGTRGYFQISVWRSISEQKARKLDLYVDGENKLLAHETDGL